MERLTRKAPGGYALVEGKQLGTVRNNREVITRLAQYENCGLDPDQVMRLVLFAKEMNKIFTEEEEVHHEESQH